MIAIEELMTDDDFLSFIENQPDDTLEGKPAFQIYSDFLAEIRATNVNI
jgi:hypothetical protein